MILMGLSLKDVWGACQHDSLGCARLPGGCGKHYKMGGGTDVRGGREDSGIDQVGVNHGVLTNDPPNCVFRNNVGIVSAVFASISDQPGSLRSMLF